MKLGRGTWFAVALVATAACGKKDEGKPAGDPKAKAGDPAAKAPGTAGTAATAPGTAAAPVTPAEPAAKPSAAGAIKVDDELMAALKAIASACTVEPKDMSITCANGEDKKVDDELLGYGQGARTAVQALPALAVALADADPKLATVAADVLGGSRFMSGWGEGVKVGDVSKEVAATLLTALPKLGAIGEYQGRRVVNAVMSAAALADVGEDAYKMLEAHPDKWVASNGWKASTLYGRMKPFAKLEAMAAGGDPAQTLLAATALNSFYDLTAEEGAVLCPWAYSKIGADAPEVEEAEIFGQIGSILTKCKGEWIDKMLDFGEAQLAKKKFDRQSYFVFRELCHDFIKGNTTQNATAEQCERDYAFLEKVANTDGVPPQYRAYALSGISYQRRDEKSLKLMNKYKKHKVKEIAAAAAEEIKMLEGYVKK